MTYIIIIYVHKIKQLPVLTTAQQPLVVSNDAGLFPLSVHPAILSSTHTVSTSLHNTRVPFYIQHCCLGHTITAFLFPFVPFQIHLHDCSLELNRIQRCNAEPHTNSEPHTPRNALTVLKRVHQHEMYIQRILQKNPTLSTSKNGSGNCNINPPPSQRQTCKGLRASRGRFLQMTDCVLELL